MDCSKLPTASKTADLLVLHVFRLHEISLDIVSDHVPKFTSQLWKAFCQAMASLSSGYIPRLTAIWIGPTRTWSLVSTLSRNVTLLPWIEYAHNSLVSSSTDMSPFMASLGFQPPLFPAQEEEVADPSFQANLHRCHNQCLADRYCPQPLSTSLDRKFGSPPETSRCKLNPVSWTYWTLDTLDLLRSRKLSTHLLSG